MHLSMHSKHPCIRSNRLGSGLRETTPEQSLGASICAETLRSSPSTGDARSSLLLHNHNLGKMRAACQGRRSHQSLHRASSRRQAKSFPSSVGTALALERKSLAGRPHLEHFALGEGARPKLSERIPPSPLLCHELSQLRAEIHDLRMVMQKLVRKEQQDSFKAQLGAEKGANNNQNNNNNNNNNNDTDKNNKDTTNNNNNDTDTNNKDTTNNNTTNNNNNNEHTNYSDNTRISQELSLQSFNLDNANPESDLSGSDNDLDESSLESFDPSMMQEESSSSLDLQSNMLLGTSFGSFDQHCLGALGHQMMTIGYSLGSLPRSTQQQQRWSSNSFDQEGQVLDEDQHRVDFGLQPPKQKKKKVTFSKEALEACRKKDSKQQNKGSHPGSLQLEQLRLRQQQTWHNEPSRMQQQTAPASEKKLEHRPCTNKSLGREEGTLGNKKQNASTTNLQACNSPEPAWGILVDTGAAVSLAPLSFAPETELQPLDSTFHLRTVTGTEIKASGFKTVHFAGRELSFDVRFVIAEVDHALLGFDIFRQEQLGIAWSNQGEIHLVNRAGAKTQLFCRGHLLYLEACSMDAGLTTCKRSSLPLQLGSLLDNKNGTLQDAAFHDELENQEVQSSGGASGTSFALENLRQHKNTTCLGEPALSQQGPQTTMKKPSAKEASHNQLDENSSEQIGQNPAAAPLRSLEKTSLIEEIELAAGDSNQTSFNKVDRQELCMRILLILSLRFKWQLVKTRATPACSGETLGQQLRNIGLDNHQLAENIFSGDELVVLLDQHDLLIGGADEQQEAFFIELSALASLDQPQRLDRDTPISFCSKILEWDESSYSINISLPTCFYKKLLDRHELADAESIGNLEEEQLSQDASKQCTALDAHRQEAYKQTVGELVWASTCRPDISFEVHLLTQSLESPTTEQEEQLHRVLRYIQTTLHYTLSLHPTSKMIQKKAQSLQLLAFSSSSWTSPCTTTSTASVFLWGVPVIASHNTACASQQAIAELASVKLALHIACFTRSFLQHLSVDQLAKEVRISLKTHSWHEELVTGKPLAMMLGLSRKHKRIEFQALNGQLQLSKIHPDKNPAYSLANIASDATRMLAQLRVLEAKEIIALTTGQKQQEASFRDSSSIVGMVSLEPSMESLQLSQLDCTQSCYARPSLTEKSLSFAKISLQSNSLQRLTLLSLSFEECNLQSLPLPSLNHIRDRPYSLTSQSLSFDEVSFQSLTLISWSFQRDILESLILLSLSLSNLTWIAKKSFSRKDFQEGNLEEGSLKELVKDIAHNLALGGAETNSFPHLCCHEDLLAMKLVDRVAGTNSFSQKSLLRIVSLIKRLSPFQLDSLELTCAALFFGTCLVNTSFQNLSDQLCSSNPDSLISQLDLTISLSLNKFGSISRQLDQIQSFDHNNQLQRTSLENKKRNKQLQHQQLPARELSHLHLSQLHHSDQPFRGRKQLPKEPCFTSCSFSKMISSFSKQKLGRLHLTCSILELDEHNKQLSHKHFQQLCEHHLQATSFHRNKQQQQLSQQSFDNKMKKQQLREQGSQLGVEQPARAYGSMSLQQLTRSNSLQRFELPNSALLFTALAAYSLVVSQHKSFQLTLQQLGLSEASGGDLLGAFPPAWCITLCFPALTFISLSLAVAWLKSSRSDRRRRRALSTTSSITSAFTTRPLAAVACAKATSRTRAWTRTSSSLATWITATLRTSAFRRTTSNNPTCRMRALQTTSLPRTSSNTSSSTASTSASPTRRRSLMSTILFSILLIRFSFDKDIAINSLLNNELSANFSEELVEQEANIKAKSLQLSQLQIQDRELGQQEQNQLANTLASIQQLQLNQFQLQNLLWEQELAELLVAKSCPLGLFHGHLGQEQLLPEHLSQNLLEIEKKKQKLANKELEKKNFEKNSFQPDSLDNIPEGAFRQQLSADSFSAASQNRQLRNSLAKQSAAKAASLHELSPAYSQGASGKRALSQKELQEAQLADKTFDQNTFAADSLQTRTSARQRQTEELQEENLPEHSFKALCLSSLEEASFNKNSFLQKFFFASCFWKAGKAKCLQAAEAKCLKAVLCEVLFL